MLVITLFVVTSTSVAEAGFFKDFFKRLVNPINITSTILGLPIPSNNVFFLAMSTVGILTGCVSSSVDGIPSQCLDSAEREKLNIASQFLKNRQYLVAKGSGSIDPYAHYRQHTSSLINWDNALVQSTYLVGHAVGCSNGALACHVVDGTTFFTKAGLAYDPAYLAGILLHEADHYNKMHTCGEAADADINGPYGLEAKYDMSTYLNPPPGMTEGQRAIVQSRATGIAIYQLCNNMSARTEVLNYTNAPSRFVGNQPSNINVVLRGQPFSPRNLGPNQAMQATNVRLVFQADGNLVLYNNQNRALWASNTSGRNCTSGCLASFQEAGNLVLYQNGQPYWASSAYAATKASLLIKDSPPYLEIRQANKELVWTTNPELVFGRLEYMVTAPNVRNSADVQIAFQTDGNLVVYDNAWNPLWASNTGGRDCNYQNCRAQFQEDGNLVLYENFGGNWYPYWASGAGANAFIVRNDPYSPIAIQ